MNSSKSLYQKNIGKDFFSGFSFNNKGERDQIGIIDPIFNSEIHTKLEVGYNNESNVMYCFANGRIVHQRHANLTEFFIEIRLELVEIESEFEITFEDFNYTCYDGDYKNNIHILNGWDSNYPPVFISYSHKDRKEVCRIVDILKNNGVRVLGDWNFNVGDSLLRKISSSVRKSSCLLVMLSKESIQSNWVNKELEIAMNAEIGNDIELKVLPILLEECQIPLFITGKLYQKNDTDISLLIKALRNHGVWN